MFYYWRIIVIGLCIECKYRWTIKPFTVGYPPDQRQINEDTRQRWKWRWSCPCAL